MNESGGANAIYRRALWCIANWVDGYEEVICPQIIAFARLVMGEHNEEFLVEVERRIRLEPELMNKAAKASFTRETMRPLQGNRNVLEAAIDEAMLKKGE